MNIINHVPWLKLMGVLKPSRIGTCDRRHYVTYSHPFDPKFKINAFEPPFMVKYTRNGGFIDYDQITDCNTTKWDDGHYSTAQKTPMAIEFKYSRKFRLRVIVNTWQPYSEECTIKVPVIKKKHFYARSLSIEEFVLHGKTTMEDVENILFNLILTAN